MANLILHIGGYKTGSTYLQSFFTMNRAYLKSVGITYPYFDGLPAHHALAAKWVGAPDAKQSAEKMGGAMAVWRRLVSDFGASDTTVLVSTELLSNDAIDLDEVSELTRSFDSVRVVYFARTQAALAQSIWQQLARSGKRRAIHAYMKSAIETQKIGGVLLDHNAVYSRLAHAFGAHNVRVINFDDAGCQTVGLERSFFKSINSHFNSTRVTFPDHSSHNASFDPLTYFFGSAINADPGSDLLTLTGKAVRRAQGQHNTTTLLARHEYRKMATAFRRGNAQLTERVRRFQPDFDFRLPDPPANTLFRSEKEPDIWVEIAQTLYRQREKTNANSNRFWPFIKTPG